MSTTIMPPVVVAVEDSVTCDGCKSHGPGIYYQVRLRPAGGRATFCNLCMAQRQLTMNDATKTINVIGINEIEAQRARVARAMKSHGGSFVQSLGEMLNHADTWNTLKIFRCWMREWNEYLAIAARTGC